MEPTEQNRRAWDEVHGRRSETMADRLGIPPTIRERLPDLDGKHVLHLQCATGESTAVLAELGALVTGVDISGEAIAVAQERAPTAAFVQADVHELPLQLTRGRFDLVYTGGGVFPWLHDLGAWASQVAAALRPGGGLIAYDDHPVATCVDPTSRWVEDYFDDTPFTDVGWNHFELPGESATEQKHERFWRLGEIVTAVAGAGLTVEALEEFSNIYKTQWRVRDPRVPGQFVLRARKPPQAPATSRRRK